MAIGFTALHSSAVEHKKPQLRLIGDDEQHHILRFEIGIVPTVVLALLQRTHEAKAAQDQRQIEVQPLEVLTVEPLAFRDGGQMGLVLHLDGGLDVPLHLTPDTIALLKTALASIESIAAPRDPNKPTH